MPDFTNIVTVDLTEATGYNVEAHRAVHQWDSGVILQLTGATFPQGTTCQFDTKTTTFNQELTDGACEIPNALLGYDMIGDIKAHVKIDDDNYGIVVYDIHIPVIRRPKPDSYIYTDNSSSSNGWIKSRYGYRVNEDQTILGQTELSINDNQTILNGTSLSLNNQQTVLDGTHLSLASGLFYADSTGITFASGAFQAEGNRLRINSGRITIGPTQLLVDSRVFGTVNMFDLSKCNNGQFDNNGNAVNGLRCISDFIAVKEGTSYRVSKPSGIQLYSICYYDKLQQFKRRITPGVDLNYTFTTTTGEVYVRLEFRRSDGTAIPISDFGPIQMEEGSVESSIVTHALDNAELTKRRFLQNFESKNLAPMGVLQQGGINSDSGGTPFDAQNRCRTDFISVEPDTTYTVSMSSNATPSAIRCYQVKSTLYSTITQPTDHINTLTFRVPSGCHYIRFVIVNSTSSSSNLSVSDITKFQLELGPEATPYQPYALNSSDNCYVNELKSKNLLDSSNIVKGDYDGTNPTIRASVRVNVKPSSAYTLRVSNCYVTGVVYFNSSGSLISWTNFGTVTATFVTPASCVAIAAVFNKALDAAINPSDVINPQLEEGPIASPYVPYAMDNIDLTAKTTRLLQTYEPLIADGKTISPNVNLNTAAYCDVGRYVCPLSTTPATLVNCPTRNAFYMIVRNATKTDINTSTLTWQYLIREITDVNGNQYTQTAFCGSTAGSWVFGVWSQIITDYTRKTPSLVGGYGTNISIGTNLNTDLSLWRVGRFYITATASVTTLINCPTAQAFNMSCENVQGTALDGQQYQYMRRTIKDLIGDTYVQTGAWASDSALVNVSEWKKVLTDTPSKYAMTSITSATDTNLSLTENFGGNWYRKSGNVVEINLSVSGADNGWRTVTTLPEAYRPPMERYFSAITLAFGVGAIFVSSTGLVRVRTASGTGTVGGCITYIV